jgi:integrase
VASGVIRVERSWDVTVGIVSLKSRAGARKVPVAAALRDHLLEHRLLTNRAEGFVFGDSASQPFDPTAVRRRANDTWRGARLERITLHECRHTLAR